MRVREVACKSALVPTRLPGLDYALNPYRGCAIGCAYCYSPSVLREERPWGRFVDVKRNAPSVLARELKRARRGVVGIGTVTDGYQPVEMRYHVTRYCLEQLIRHGFPVSIQTKSSLVLRDLAYLHRLDDVEVGVTLTTLDDGVRRRLEPFASPPARRIALLRKLNEEGIRTWAFVGPILPRATAETLPALLEAVAAAGTRHVLYDRLRFHPGVWERLAPVAEDAGLLEEFRAAHDGAPAARAPEAEIVRLGRALGLRVEAAFPEGVPGTDAPAVAESPAG